MSDRPAWALQGPPFYRFIPGVPVPQGSHAIVGRVGQRGKIIDSNKALDPWRETIAWGLQRVELWPAGTPVQVAQHFVLPRRKSDAADVAMRTEKPDLDKLERAVCDAITGLICAGDQQIISLYGTKRTADIGQRPGLHLFWALCPELPPIPIPKGHE